MNAINCGESANIIVTQPRQVAAMALVKRVAEERNTPPPAGRAGSEVGYNVRLSRAVSKATKIFIVSHHLDITLRICQWTPKLEIFLL